MHGFESPDGLNLHRLGGHARRPFQRRMIGLEFVEDRGACAQRGVRTRQPQFRAGQIYERFLGVGVGLVTDLVEEGDLDSRRVKEGVVDQHKGEAGEEGQVVTDDAGVVIPEGKKLISFN